MLLALDKEAVHFFWHLALSVAVHRVEVVAVQTREVDVVLQIHHVSGEQESDEELDDESCDCWLSELPHDSNRYRRNEELADPRHYVGRLCYVKELIVVYGNEVLAVLLRFEVRLVRENGVEDGFFGGAVLDGLKQGY